MSPQAGASGRLSATSGEGSRSSWEVPSDNPGKWTVLTEPAECWRTVGEVGGLSTKYPRTTRSLNEAQPGTEKAEAPGCRVRNSEVPAPGTAGREHKRPQAAGRVLVTPSTCPVLTSADLSLGMRSVSAAVPCLLCLHPRLRNRDSSFKYGAWAFCAYGFRSTDLYGLVLREARPADPRPCPSPFT